MLVDTYFLICYFLLIFLLVFVTVICLFWIIRAIPVEKRQEKRVSKVSRDHHLVKAKYTHDDFVMQGNLLDYSVYFSEI